MSDYKEQEFKKADGEYFPLTPEFDQKPEYAKTQRSVSEKSRKSIVKRLFYFVAATVVIGSFIVSGAILSDAYKETSLGQDSIADSGGSITTAPVAQPSTYDAVLNIIYSYRSDSTFYLQDTIDYYSLLKIDSTSYPSYNNSGVSDATNQLDQSQISSRYSEIGQYFEANKNQAIQAFKNEQLFNPTDVSKWFDKDFEADIDGTHYKFTITLATLSVSVSSMTDTSSTFTCSDTYIDKDGRRVGATGFYFSIYLKKASGDSESPNTGTTDSTDQPITINLAHIFSPSDAPLVYGDPYVIVQFTSDGSNNIYNSVSNSNYYDSDLVSVAQLLDYYGMDKDKEKTVFNKYKDDALAYIADGIGSFPNIDATSYFPSSMDFRLAGKTYTLKITEVTAYLSGVHLNESQVTNYNIDSNYIKECSDGTFFYVQGIAYDLDGFIIPQ